MSRKSAPRTVESRKGLVVRAATSVFLRYGYARTTMAELATAATLSRPTLYEMFPGKDEIFSAVIQDLSHQAIEEYRQTLPKLRTLQSKLRRFCGHWATHGLRLGEQYPDAKDLFDLKFPAVRAMYEDFIKFLVEVISTEPHTMKISTEKLVRNLVYSLKGLKDAARDVEHMEELVRLQVDVFVATLTPSE